MYKKREGNKLWDSQGKEHGNESNEGTKAKHMDNLKGKGHHAIGRSCKRPSEKFD